MADADPLRTPVLEVADDEPRVTARLIFHGLSDAAKIGILIAATLIAMASLIWGVVSWSMVNDGMRFNGDDYLELTTFFERVSTGTNHDTYLLTHAIDLHVQMQRITNEQGLKSLAISLCVALVAVGFALFLLGADGTFSLAAAGKSGPSVAVQGTAPGLLCFALAAIVMGMVVMTGAELKIEPGELPSPPLPLPRSMDEAYPFYSMWGTTQGPPVRSGAIPSPSADHVPKAVAPESVSDLVAGDRAAELHGVFQGVFDEE